MSLRPMTMYRGALVGCGFFSLNHLHAWNDLSDRCRIVAVCDIDRNKAEAMAARFGIASVYDDVTEMLTREDLDFVDIATTAPSHRAIVEACAAKGCAAIVQKPLAPGWEDARALVAAMNNAGVPLMVHENFRFQAPLLKAADVVRSGELGDPVWGRISFRTGFDIYAGQPYLAEVERFILLDVGIHVLDVARVFMGEVDSVYCRSQSVRPGLKGEDMATLMLGHAGGATSVVEMTYASHQDPDPFPQVMLQFEGTKGAIRIDPGYRMTVTTKSGSRMDIVAPNPLSWGSEPWTITQDSVRAIQRHWLDCLDAGTQPSTSGHDNLRTFALVEAAYASAANGLAVMPDRAF